MSCPNRRSADSKRSSLAWWYSCALFRTRSSPLEVQDRKFLVDLEQDVGEKTNLSAKNEKLVKELSAIHERLSAGF